MGFFSRLGHGALNVLTAPLRILATPFTFVGKMLGTGYNTLKELASFNLTGALGTLVGGTAKNVLDAGITLASSGNPAISFVDGFARDSIRYS